MQPPPPAYNPDSGQKPPVAQAVQAMPVQAQPVIVGVPGMIALPPANSVRVTPFPPSSVQIFESATPRSARANRLPGEVRRRPEVSPGQNLAEGSHPHALHPISIFIFPPGAGRVALQHVRGRRGRGGAEAVGGVICTNHFPARLAGSVAGPEVLSIDRLFLSSSSCARGVASRRSMLATAPTIPPIISITPVTGFAPPSDATPPHIR
jgi:hypothetical protein